MRCLALVLVAVLVSGCGQGEEQAPQVIRLQVNYSPLRFDEGMAGGVHPIGGRAAHFVDLANAYLSTIDTRFELHVGKNIHAVDISTVAGPIIDTGISFDTLHAATAAGSANGGLDAAISVPSNSGLSFGTLLVSSSPFGMEPDEYIGYLYAGGGLALQQQLYDAAYNDQIVVLPIAVTATQSAGWFPQPLPEPDMVGNASDARAMADLCQRNWVVRWASPAAQVWQRACTNVGVDSAGLEFGTYVPGGMPQAQLLAREVDAYELSLPVTDIHMIKMVLGEELKSNSEADLRAVISLAPYLYGGAWHQPLTYSELLLNRDFWNSMSDQQRTGIELAAGAATLSSLAISLEAQAASIDTLQENGAILMRWPDGLLRQLHQARDEYLYEHAGRLTAAGDNSFARVLQSIDNYRDAHAEFSDFGDVNQGTAQLPTSLPN